LQAPPGRPIPTDLDEALTEVVALRHVLAHRAGRVDRRAVKQAPTLRYADGDLVRIPRDEYRRYSAALWTYGEEVIHRLMKDLAPAPSLHSWLQNYTLNA
jgi:CubicO group peptidase (beta-lactamase class C family)